MEREALEGETPAADGTAAERRARDLAWLARMREADDTAAFEMLFNAYVVPLVRFAQRRVASRELARDIVTDVMVELWRRRRTLQIQTTLSAYLYGAVLHKARRHAHHLALERYWQRQWTAEGYSLAVGTHALRGESDIDTDLDTQFVREAVAALLAQARRVAELRWFEGLSRAEIGSEAAHRGPDGQRAPRCRDADRPRPADASPGEPRMSAPRTWARRSGRGTKTVVTTVTSVNSWTASRGPRSSRSRERGGSPRQLPGRFTDKGLIRRA
jgi:RNA polymerase sigma factor (sigma-70 family)